jgi:hypothetical protein
MIRLFKKRLEDTFRIGKENGFRKFFRNWLSVDDFGICRPCRTAKKPHDFDLAEQQATEPDRGVPCPEPDSDAWESPGSVALYLLLKKRDEKALSDKTAEDVSDSGKAMQE